MTVNILTMKWGDYYGPHYVNRLYWAVKRNLNRSFRFLCYTDDPTGIVPEVECHPMIDVKYSQDWHEKHWNKLGVFREGGGTSDLEGTCLFLDLDTLIVDSIDCMFDYAPGEFCLCSFPGTSWQKLRTKLKIKENKRMGHTPIFRFEANTMEFILQNFEENSEKILREYINEQEYVTDMVRNRFRFWPNSWVVLFRRQCRQPSPLNLVIPPFKPNGAKLIAFNAFPNMQHAIDGYSWKYLRGSCPAPWVSDYWRDEPQ